MNEKMYRINGDRFIKSIEKYAKVGGTENNGVTRLALTDEDLQVRTLFEKECKELGLPVVYDDLGNMYATLAGTQKNLPPIVMGSHLDSVAKGGKFDGVLGVLTGLEVVRTLLDYNVQPSSSIVIANITNEEGARFEPAMMSSGILSGRFDKEKMFQSTDNEGITFGEALNRSEYEGDSSNRLKQAAAFLELHIEQGPILESENIDIGIVEGVMGMVNYEIVIEGDSNHAGTTPMHLRKDALFTANDLIQKLREDLSQLDEDLVYTIGRFHVTPNVHTIVPGKVVFTVEARHKDEHVIEQVENVITSSPSSIKPEGCSIALNKQWDRNTIWFNKEIVKKIEASCQHLKVSYRPMVSGAGHDSQFISTYIPTAMIFVPSINGKSHSEDEFTPREDCVNGGNVMLQTVLELLNSK